MINRVKPQPSDDPFKRGQTDRIRGGKQGVEKSREVDPEEQKRRKFKQHLEEKKPETSAEKEPSPYESEFYDKGPAETASVDKKLPESKEKIQEPPKEGLVHKAPGKKESDGEIKIAKPEEGFEPSTKQVPSKEAKEVKSTEHLKNLREDESKLEEKKPEIKKATGKEVSKDDSEAKKEHPPTIHTVPIVVPSEIQQNVAEITNNLKVHLSPVVSPIFEQMIGKILVMGTKEGIMQTEVILDSPEMENSPFYGSKIVLEKYSTAPDSFNIRLTGTPEAVTIFNGNIDILMDAFRRGNFNFRIGRIEASYSTERPLFRRKEKSDLGEAGGGPLER